MTGWRNGSKIERNLLKTFLTSYHLLNKKGGRIKMSSERPFWRPWRPLDSLSRVGEADPRPRETLVEEGWISINRLKRGPANHKAFLTAEGKKLVKAWKRDFQFLFLMKDKGSYIFTSERKPNQKFRRERITLDVNKVTHYVSKLLPSKPNITSHSFRIDYISQLACLIFYTR